MMRGLKTTPVSVLSYGVKSTKNTLTTRSKLKAQETGKPYSKTLDPYRNMYEDVAMTETVDARALDIIGSLETGTAPEGSLADRTPSVAARRTRPRRALSISSGR